ncbi:MAG: HAMP domain-containing protein [Candidatus Thiodiazotropha sp. (ex Lucinoma borealis)]|nr:HAMP domain-containing protein [Candidatus Thiodiazotropha sp. (ex Lucinoma borealis)]MCU7869434.1 HAMP domain-containing protein [Candidatus Thiodiazotropha sp. (ex Lucinoma borealis)]
MSFYFIKIYLAVILFTIAVFFLTIFVIFESVLLKSDWKDFKEELVVDHQLLMLKLDQTPENQWEQIVAEYQPVFGMVPELVEWESLDSVERQALTGEGSRQYLSDFSLDVWYGLFTLPDSDRILKILEDGSPLNDITADNVIWLILPILLILSSQAFGTILIIRSISKPVRELSETALSFGKGDFSTRMEKPRPPVDMLAHSFNTMAGQLEEKIREQQLMIGAIPHELRTPLSRIRFALDLSRSRRSYETLQLQIEQIDAYVDDLDCAVEDVLELTRLQSGKASIDEEIDLCKLIHSVTDGYQDTGVAIDIACQEGAAVYGNEGLMRRALHNLMQNAIRFAETMIAIDVEMANRDVVILVEDDGVGIPADKLEEMFLVFSRLDKSRSRETGGIGLGLAFVQLIMHQHNGVALARNRESGGLCVELRWPGVNRTE